MMTWYARLLLSSDHKMRILCNLQDLYVDGLVQSMDYGTTAGLFNEWTVTGPYKHDWLLHVLRAVDKQKLHNWISEGDKLFMADNGPQRLHDEHTHYFLQSVLKPDVKRLWCLDDQTGIQELLLALKQKDALYLLNKSGCGCTGTRNETDRFVTSVTSVVTGNSTWYQRTCIIDFFNLLIPQVGEPISVADSNLHAAMALLDRQLGRPPSAQNEMMDWIIEVCEVLSNVIVLKLRPDQRETLERCLFLPSSDMIAAPSDTHEADWVIVSHSVNGTMPIGRNRSDERANDTSPAHSQSVNPSVYNSHVSVPISTMVWVGLGICVAMILLFVMGVACQRNCRRSKKEQQSIDGAVEEDDEEGKGDGEVNQGSTEGNGQTEEVNECGYPVLKKREMDKVDETVETMC